MRRGLLRTLSWSVFGLWVVACLLWIYVWFALARVQTVGAVMSVVALVGLGLIMLAVPLHSWNPSKQHGAGEDRHDTK